MSEAATQQAENELIARLGFKVARVSDGGHDPQYGPIDPTYQVQYLSSAGKIKAVCPTVPAVYQLWVEAVSARAALVAAGTPKADSAAG